MTLVNLLLIEVAHRLKIHVRETDTVARLGGDEFVVMLEDLAEDFAMAVNEAEKMAKHLISVVQHEFSLQGYAYHCSCSIGASMFSGQQAVEELIKHADTAMYQVRPLVVIPLVSLSLRCRQRWNHVYGSKPNCGTASKTGQLRVFYQVQMGLHQQVLGARGVSPLATPRAGHGLAS